MIRLAIKQGMLGEGRADWHDIEWHEGVTVGVLKRRVAELVPANVVVGVDGKQIDDDDEVVPDGATVVVMAATGWVELGSALLYGAVSAVISLAVNYLFSLFAPTPKPPGLGQDRGDERSPTYAWDAIQTSYGQGQPIAAVLGEHAVGGQVISSRIDPANGGTGEVMSIVLALLEGPIRAIGQYTTNQNQLGELSGSGPTPTQLPLPEGFYINDNLQDATATIVPELEAWLRLGQLSQSALPAARFPGASTLYALTAQLNDVDDEVNWTYSGTDSLSAFQVAMRAPGGLYSIQATGSTLPLTVLFEVRWRPVGELVWRTAFTSAGLSNPTMQGGPAVAEAGYTFAETFHFGAPGAEPIDGPIQIQIRRTTAAGSLTTDISQVVMRSIELVRPQEFAYPGIALMGLAIRATGTVSGALPRFKVRCKGALVRVWDAEAGFSERIWEPQTTGPFAFATLVGQNPAWLLGEFATNKRWGMGNELTDENVDWPKLRRWAIQCQDQPVGWAEARYMCDLVLDTQRPAWDTVLAICMAGRAAPVWIGSKLSVVYQYRDAHSDSGVSVPAKQPVQLITSALCEEVQVRFLEKKGRATAIDFQFLDREQAYAQNVETVEDAESNINDPTDPNSEPFITASIQAYGITRRSQLVRQGYYLHRVSRLVRRELTFTCGPWMLAAEVGELIDFQHDMLQPFDDEVGLVAQVVLNDVDNDIRLLVDHDVKASSPMPWLAARQPDGAPVYREIESLTKTSYRGRKATLLTLRGDPITIDKGASCVIGAPDKLVETYQIVGISLAQDMRRVVRCLQWVPEIYDPVPQESTESAVSGLLAQPSLEPSDVYAEQIEVDRSAAGPVTVSWSRPKGNTGHRARVYARPDAASVWVFVGETDRAAIEMPWPTAWRSATFSVVLERTNGSFESPEMATKADVTMPEFPAVLLPAPGNVRAQVARDSNRLDLSWSAVSGGEVVGYEVRAGEHWAAGPRLYAGTDARVVLSPAPAHPTLQVAAVHRSGLYGKRTALTVPVTALPYAGAVLVDSTEFAPTNAGGTHGGTAYVDSHLELASGLQGTFTTTEVDFGYQAPFFLRLALAVRELDNATVNELAAVAVGGGESFWRTVDTRPASPGAPGINWDLALDDVAATPIDELPDLLSSGLGRGEAGSHVRCAVESRTYSDGAWSEWQPHRDRTVTCSRWQARLLFGRSSLQRSVQATTLRLEALI